MPDTVLNDLQAPRELDGLRLLKEFVGSLRQADREIFDMYWNELSYCEISEITGLGENCLRMRISSLKKRLEERMMKS